MPETKMSVIGQAHPPMVESFYVISYARSGHMNFILAFFIIFANLNKADQVFSLVHPKATQSHWPSDGITRQNKKRLKTKSSTFPMEQPKTVMVRPLVVP
jgi:hypothetical protein